MVTMAAIEFALCGHCVLLIRRVEGGPWEHYDRFDPIAAHPIPGSELPDDVPEQELRRMAEEADRVSGEERRYRAVYVSNMEAFMREIENPIRSVLRESRSRREPIPRPTPEERRERVLAERKRSTASRMFRVGARRGRPNR